MRDVLDEGGECHRVEFGGADHVGEQRHVVAGCVDLAVQVGTGLRLVPTALGDLSAAFNVVAHQQTAPPVSSCNSRAIARSSAPRRYRARAAWWCRTAASHPYRADAALRRQHPPPACRTAPQAATAATVAMPGRQRFTPVSSHPAATQLARRMLTLSAGIVTLAVLAFVGGWCGDGVVGALGVSPGADFVIRRHGRRRRPVRRCAGPRRRCGQAAVVDSPGPQDGGDPLQLVVCGRRPIGDYTRGMFCEHRIVKILAGFPRPWGGRRGTTVFCARH